jgi:type II secretory pathway component HofQ
MRVTEGARTRIETGTTVPYATTSTPGRRPGTELVTAATGFEASARILDDGRVQVDLAAFAGRLRRGGAIETTNAHTPVIVTPGETVAVAGLDRSGQASHESTLQGARSAARRDDTVLLLRADLE